MKHINLFSLLILVFGMMVGQQANALNVSPSMVTVFVNGQPRMVPNCVTPVFSTLMPQNGYAAAQTCSCSWSQPTTSPAILLTCALPQGSTVVQQADPSVYLLVQSNEAGGKLVPISSRLFCTTVLGDMRVVHYTDVYQLMVVDKGVSKTVNAEAYCTALLQSPAR